MRNCYHDLWRKMTDGSPDLSESTLNKKTNLLIVDSKTIIKLGYHKISWFASVSQIKQLICSPLTNNDILINFVQQLLNICNTAVPFWFLLGVPGMSGFAIETRVLINQTSLSLKLNFSSHSACDCLGKGTSRRSQYRNYWYYWVQTT